MEAKTPLELYNGSRKDVPYLSKENPPALDYITFSYLNKVVDAGNRKPFNFDMLNKVRKEHTYEYNYPLFKELVEKELKEKPGTEYHTIFIKYLSRYGFVKGEWIQAASYLIQIPIPYLIKLLLEWIEDEDAPGWHGWSIVLIIAMLSFFKPALMHYGTSIKVRLSVMGEICTRSLLMNKVLNLPLSARKHLDLGQVSTILSTDIINFNFWLLSNFHTTLAPCLVVIYTLMLFTELNYVGLLVPIIILGMIFIQKVINKNITKLQGTILMKAESRGKKVSEIVNGIKMIKFNAWEPMLIDQTQKIRQSERDTLFRYFLLKSISENLGLLIPLLCCLICFPIYKITADDLTVSKTFSLLTLFTNLLFPIKIYFLSWNTKFSALVSSKRIDKIIGLEANPLQSDDLGIDKGVVEIKGGDFSWIDDSLDELFESEEEKKKKRLKNSEGDKVENEILRKDQENNSDGDALVLRDVNLKIDQGEFVAIVGSVGCGKSSLLMAMMNELRTTSGSVSKNGKIAYIPQEAFLLNATLKDNIIFGHELDEKKYEEVVKICQLEADLAMFPGGDQTQIGERGINLSGGQKQRISIARAVYADSDIFLIDDALSALDAGVSAKMMDFVFNGVLREKTRIMVTHKLEILHQMDRIIMIEKGNIVLNGPYFEVEGTQKFKEFSKIAKIIEIQSQIIEEEEEEEEDEELDEEGFSFSKDHNMLDSLRNNIKGLAMDDRGAFDLQGDLSVAIDEENSVMSVENTRKLSKSEKRSERLKELVRRRKHSAEDDILKLEAIKIEKQKTKASLNTEELKAKGRLTAVETKQKGQMKSEIYTFYLKSAGCLKTAVTIASFCFLIYSKIAADWWIGSWARDSYGFGDAVYISIYAVMVLIVILAVLSRSASYSSFVTSASYNLFNGVIKNILRRPMSFFDTTPSGAIMNRCGKDVNDCDFMVPIFLSLFTDNFFTYIGSLMLLSLVFPAMIALIILVICLLARYIGRYMGPSVEISRLMKLATSPVLSKLSEIMNGYVSLRNYNKQDYVMKGFVDSNNLLANCTLHGTIISFYLRTRIDYTVFFLITVSFFFFVINKDYQILLLSDTGSIGLAIAYIISMTNMTTMFVLTMTRTSREMSSVERIKEYLVCKNHEKEWNTPKAPKSWPTHGAIEVKDLSARYREGLPLALNKLCFSIKAGQKLAVVGRTGSGKSTLLLALMRILERTEDEKAEQKNKISQLPSENDKEGGYISIDGVKAHQIGLHELRRGLVIIPQDPFLLKGTLRFNIDPMNEYSDETILACLRKVDVLESLASTMSPSKQKSSLNHQDDNTERLSDGTPNSTLSMSTSLADSQMSSAQQQLKTRKEIELKQLEMQIEDQGSNLSIGQRQLVCIARALIKDPKILLMDEATANIDHKTDEKVQRVISDMMPNTTVITIAHRLNTIIGYDRVLVMGKGSKIEMGSPYRLMMKEGGEFRDMVMEGGEEFFDDMLKIAKDDNDEDDVDEIERF